MWSLGLCRHLTGVRNGFISTVHSVFLSFWQLLFQLLPGFFRLAATTPTACVGVTVEVVVVVCC